MRNLSFSIIAGIVALSLVFFAHAATQRGLGYKDTPNIPGTPWCVHDGTRPQPRVVTSGASFSQGAAAPSDLQPTSAGFAPRAPTADFAEEDETQSENPRAADKDVASAASTILFATPRLFFRSPAVEAARIPPAC